MLKLAISGACGKMGSRIVSLAEKDPEVEIGGLIELASHPSAGTEIQFRDKTARIEIDVRSVLLKSDVLVEFTNPTATLVHLELAEELKKSVVIGTTGFTDDEIQKIKDASVKIPIVFAPNMSFGVNLLLRVIEDICKVLKDYDVEIVEFHHNQKKDAPSGTAIKLAEIVAGKLNKKIIHGREGFLGARKKEELGVHSVRGGDIVGEHTIYFVGQGETIALTHRAHSRDCFASGAIQAAKWLVNQKAGLYTMQDVLSL